MLKKLSSVVVLALVLGGQQFVANSVFAQETAPAAEAAAPAPEAAAPAEAAAPNIIDKADAATKSESVPGLGQLWAGPNGVPDYVSRTVLILMVIMSAGTWYITAIKLLTQQTLYKQASEARRVWESKSLQDGVSKLKEDNAFRAIAEDGLKAVKHHDGKLTDKIDLESWVSMSISRSVTNITNDLQSGMAVLATVASSSPFVGLFGTVWGIYHALIAIAASGQADIAKVAGPVGEALIMTAIGLAVAVPAVFFYNWLIRRNKIAVESLQNFAADVHAYLVVGVSGNDK
jgi:biopolymer transport protein ExbB